MISLLKYVLMTGQDLNWSDQSLIQDFSLWLLSFGNVIQTTKKELYVKKTNKKLMTFFTTSSLRLTLYTMKLTLKVINLLVFNVPEKKKLWWIDSCGWGISEHKREELSSKANFFNIMNSQQETVSFHSLVPRACSLSYLLLTSTLTTWIKMQTPKVCFTNIE